MLRAAKSLTLRVLAVQTLSLIAVGAALPLIARSTLERSAERYQTTSLHEQAAAIGSAVHADGTNGWRLELPPDLRSVYATGYDGRAYLVVDAAGRIEAASPFARREVAREAGLAGAHSFRTGSLIGLSLPVRISPRPHWIVVTQDQARPGAIVDDVSASFLKRYLSTLALIVGLVALASVAISWRLFGHVRTLAASASDIGPRHLGRQLDERGLPTEFVVLVREFNALLGRIEAAFRAQEEFAGNVAHELRTPLATLRLELAHVAEPKVRDRLTRSADHMAHVLSQLSDLASLESARAIRPGPVSMLTVAVEVVAELAPHIVADGHAIGVTGEGNDVAINGDRVLIGLALSNLVRNAAQHSPPGTYIEVMVQPGGALAVFDNGPGVAESDRPNITRRFWRADQQRSDGAGLGLSIVQRIVDVLGGTLTVANRVGGGACFVIRFPLAGADAIAERRNVAVMPSA